MWSVYLIRCRDNSLYCGATTDVERRVDEHNKGICGAKYTVGRGPVELVWSKAVGSRSDALRLEAAIKKMSKRKKEDLVTAEGGDGYGGEVREVER